MATTESLNYVQSLYVAYYGRPADKEGLEFWADRADAEGNAAIVNAFGTSEEFTELSSGLSSQELITNLYQQMFGRSAEQEGVNFYSDLLESGESSLAQIAVSIMAGAQGNDRIVLNTKERAADYYTENAPSYDADSAKALLSGISGEDAGADFDAAIQQINDMQDLSGVAANYQTLQTAEASLDLANQNFTSALNDLENSSLFDAYDNQDGSDADDLEAQDVTDYLKDQQVELQTSLINDGTDAELQQAVTDAAAAVRAVDGKFNADGTAGGTLSASQLFSNYLTAQTALENDVSADGSNVSLAADVNAAIAAYLANNDEIDSSPGGSATVLGDIQTAAETYLGDPSSDVNADAFLDAVGTAYDNVFSGTNDASILADGATGDSVESLLTTLDQRNDLADAAADTESAINDATSTDGEFGEYQAAVDAVEARETLRENIETAQSDQATLQAAEDAVESAEDDVESAQDDLGFDEVDLNGAGPFTGTNSSADLFVFDKEATETSTVTLEDNDAIYLGSGYTQGSFDADGNVDGDDSMLEYFFNEDSGVLTVETFADGDTSNVDLALTSDGTVPITGISVTDDGVVTVA
ncbi:DUF4214 domain-containing protein [Larsenimonas salina]|uniref:DUF4214 domain-containing protein n=1 Tax=Larsenimonas salina TaxID=1295565 RepID=UPI0020732513|nr:DUF4214 domain-containing protein [Larsenimonas salina]MCM5704926.1 DUF4214 domain-containing protein [Larsenimonas salina]